MNTNSYPSITLSSEQLSGRIAVVTGASSGIGAATGKLLAMRGAKVALMARRKNLLDQLVTEITASGGAAFAFEVDVTNQASVDVAAQAVADKLGVVNLVVNNAGIMLPAPIVEGRTEDWVRMIDLNVTGAMRVIGAFVTVLIKAAGDGQPADLINISSIAAQYVFPSFAVYSATKAAISHLSRHLRTELGPKDVRVSMIEPGIVATELQSHVTDPNTLDWLASSKNMMDWLQPEDIAEAIAFAVGLPRHVNLQQVTIMPTRQV